MSDTSCSPTPTKNQAASASRTVKPKLANERPDALGPPAPDQVGDDRRVLGDEQHDELQRFAGAEDDGRPHDGADQPAGPRDGEVPQPPSDPRSRRRARLHEIRRPP